MRCPPDTMQSTLCNSSHGPTIEQPVHRWLIAQLPVLGSHGDITSTVSIACTGDRPALQGGSLIFNEPIDDPIYPPYLCRASFTGPRLSVPTHRAGLLKALPYHLEIERLDVHTRVSPPHYWREYIYSLDYNSYIKYCGLYEG